jgi:hypothetical protein
MPSAATLSQAKASVDLAALVEAAGVELHPAGPGRLRGRCPLHQEKTPSFFVFQDRGRWRCFGCGEGGDAIDFIRKSRGCGFREALATLGLDDPKRSSAELARIGAERRRRKAERWRERELAWTLGTAIRRAHKMLRAITPDNFTSPKFSLLLSELSTLEYQHDLLVNGDASTKAALLVNLRGLRLLPRRLMFHRGFEFEAWMRSLCCDQEPHHGRFARAAGYSERTAHRAAKV